MDDERARLAESEARDFDEAMVAARGLPANTVARILRKHHPGTSYTGCSKGHIFGNIIYDGGLDKPRDNRVVGGNKRWTRRTEWWHRFLGELRAEKRPQTRKERQQQQAHEKADREDQRRKEAEGWTGESAEAELKRIRDELVPLEERVKALREQQTKTYRILETLDPLWAYRV